MSATTHRQPTLFIPHGGGPCFFMETPPGWPPDLWDRMAAYLRGIPAALPARPRAILVVSGHWEEARPTVNVAARPTLLYDYYGFPEHTYHLTYPVPGAPDLAAEVRGLLARAGIASGEEEARGLDHGVFIPLKVAFPEADIPVLQLSLQRGLDPATHLAIGRALAPLRDQGVLIIGSGMSYHNLRNLFSGRGNEDSERFDAWLAATVTDPDPARRDAGLIGWERAPAARACHPEAEHLLPLMVAAGAAGTDAGRHSYSDHILGKAVSGFQFG
jgi:aromatic ring-opening dioxygenase catalytic subunit (LigB family)